MNDFKDKIAVITGGASGIGKGLAEKCLSKGMKVVLADIQKGALNTATEELQSKGGTVISVLTDVSNPDHVKNLAQKTYNEFGRIHLLFNNAGVYLTKPLWDLSIADWKWVLGVNLWSVINSTNIFVPLMLNQEENSHIINTASLAGMLPGGGIYGMTKHAIISLTESLYFELEQIKAKIKVSVVCPWYVNTSISKSENYRPSELKNNLSVDASTTPQSDKKEKEHSRIMKRFERSIANGISCEELANAIFDGIIKESFFIIPQQRTWWQDILKSELDCILEGKNPELRPTAL